MVNETLRSWWSRLTSRLDKYSPTQKRNIAIAGLAALVCLVVVLWMLLRPRYVTIMSGLDDKSLGQVQTTLQSLKIPEQIQGSSILVPSAQADTARVQLAMVGLPKSVYIGYSSIPNSLGMTQDQFTMQVLDVLQQSLDQTIQSIDGIEIAQVHIVMPAQQLFLSQQTDTAKASVFVQVSQGAGLSSAQVAGIQQLVAHSVKGLTADNVSVVDQNGVTLSGTPSANGAVISGSSELAVRQQMEQQLTQQLTAGLDQIVGAGNAVVMVHANVAFAQTEVHSHDVVPAAGQTTGLPTSSQTIRQTTTSGNSAAGGVAGQSSSNPGLPTYAGTGSTGGGSNSSNTQVSLTYDNGYKDSTVIGDPVQINGFSVGVFLNSANKALAGTSAQSAALVQQIRAFVANAVGSKTSTGTTNSITVSMIPFQAAQTLAYSAAGYSKTLVWGAVGTVLAAAGITLFLRRRRKPAQEMGVAALQAALSDELETAPLSEEDLMKEQLAKLANRRPDQFANLLRTWLIGD